MLNFNERDYSSPVVPSYSMKVDYKKDGEEVISFPVCDNRKIQESNGTADLWSLSALSKAGVDPKFPIHTEGASQLDGYKDFSSSSDEIVDSLKEISNEN